jgi:hypothetical protein
VANYNTPISGTENITQFDHNYGTVAITVNQADQGAIQIDGVLRINSDLYLAGAGLLECLTLQNRYNIYQIFLGYPACNFVDPAAILWVDGAAV